MMSFELKGIVIPALLLGAIYAGVFLIGKTAGWLWRKIMEPRPAATPADPVHAYDKAKWHFESVRGSNLPIERSFNHTTFFFSWLVHNNLISRSLEKSREKELAEFREGLMTINDIYGGLDACLLSSMLSDDGNSFAKSYFDFQSGLWMSDLEATLPSASEYGVDYTRESEMLIHAVISRRFVEWQKSQRAA